MPSIQIRNVSADTHTVLRRRAVECGMSMQEYLVALLDEPASKPTVAEVMRRASDRIGLRRAADELRADRDSR